MAATTAAAAVAAATSGERVKNVAPLGVKDAGKDRGYDTSEEEPGAPAKDVLADISPGHLDKALPATRLLEKRRMVALVQEALDNQKAEFVQKEEVLTRREDTLRSKDLMLQKSLIGFSKFLQENGVKKNEQRRRLLMKSGYGLKSWVNSGGGNRTVGTHTGVSKA